MPGSLLYFLTSDDIFTGLAGGFLAGCWHPDIEKINALITSKTMSTVNFLSGIKFIAPSFLA
jgi:hypothetical protein